MQPGMINNGMMQPGMMYNGMMNQPGMMPGMMNQPGMMQPGMMNNGMMQPGMMNQPGTMQPGMMNQPGTMQPGAGTTNNQQGGNNPPSKPQSPPPKNMCINFYVNKDETIIGVQGNTNMTIQQLIKNFRIKLCNENIKISKYITHPTKIELDRNSTETLADKGINENITVNAIVEN